MSDKLYKNVNNINSLIELILYYQLETIELLIYLKFVINDPKKTTSNKFSNEISHHFGFLKPDYQKLQKLSSNKFQVNPIDF